MTIEDTLHIAQAINLLQKELDFADALHLACSQNHPFITLDKKLKTKADDAGVETVRLL